MFENYSVCLGFNPVLAWLSPPHTVLQHLMARQRKLNLFKTSSRYLEETFVRGLRWTRNTGLEAVSSQAMKVEVEGPFLNFSAVPPPTKSTENKQRSQRKHMMFSRRNAKQHSTFWEFLRQTSWWPEKSVFAERFKFPRRPTTHWEPESHHEAIRTSDLGFLMWLIESQNIASRNTGAAFCVLSRYNQCQDSRHNPLH